MLKILKTELAYYRFHVLAIIVISLVLCTLFFVFEPPEWNEIFALLFIGPMAFGGVVALNRAIELRDHYLLQLPVSTVTVFLARLILISILVFIPYVIGMLTFVAKGQASEAFQFVLLPALTRGFLMINVFHIQMDLSMKRLKTSVAVSLAIFLAIVYVLIIWVLVYYNSMVDIFNNIGAGVVVDYSLEPLHNLMSEELILALAIGVLILSFIMFSKERYPHETKVCRRI